MNELLNSFKLFFISSAIILSSFDISAQNRPNFNNIEKAVVIVMSYNAQGKYIGHGSGFMIDNSGTIITNYHVIEGSHSIKIKLPNEQIYFVEKITHGNKDLDIVKLSIKSSTSSFPFLEFDFFPPSKGDVCWTIGSPKDTVFGSTVSRGIVSNIHSKNQPKLLQTDAPYTHGSSGGPVINELGKVIGIVNGGDGSEDGKRANINFAILSLETLNLPVIDKKLPDFFVTKIEKQSISEGSVTFYVNLQTSWNYYTYIDGKYAGSIQGYFSGAKPKCGEEGTLLLTLNSGTHNYRIINQEATWEWTGTIKIEPQNCIFKEIQVLNTNGPTIEIKGDLDRILGVWEYYGIECPNQLIIFEGQTSGLRSYFEFTDKKSTVDKKNTALAFQWTEDLPRSKKIPLYYEYNSKSGKIKFLEGDLIFVNDKEVKNKQAKVKGQQCFLLYRKIE